MDTAALVDRDVRIGRDVIGLLTAADLSVDDAFWAYVPQVEEWRLVLSSPMVKKLGVRNSYLKMSNALHKSPLLDQIPLSRISLLAPDDDVIDRLKTLEKYRYEGALHIVRVIRSNKSPLFHITFAPYKSPGGAVPAISLDGDSELACYLHEEIGIEKYEAQKAIRELETRGSYSFSNVQLTTPQLRKLGLLHPLHSQRVYRRQ